MKVSECLNSQTQRHPRKCALYFEGKSISFSELQNRSFAVGAYLAGRGIGKGEAVALYLSNRPEAVCSLLGILSAGGVAVPLDFMLTEAEVITFLNHSQARALITQPKKDVDLAAVKRQCPHLQEIIVCYQKVEGCSFWGEMMQDSPEAIAATAMNESDLAAIFYTSGSTGHPKGVMLTARQLDNPPFVIDQFLDIREDDIFLCGGVPFSHVGGLDYILLMISFGCTIVLMERFQPFEFLKHVQNHKVTIFCIVPAMFVALLSLKEYDSFDLSSLRCAAVFGAPSSPALLKRFHKAYPKAQLSNGWGMTETAAPNTLSEPGDEHIKSIGKFTSRVNVKIVDNESKSLGPGQQGELWIKGDAVMPGYFREDALTKEVLTDDGWLKTGDIAYYDQDGFYYIAGRKKDVIKVAGEIVFSGEVEEKILAYPAVKEAAVIGVSDRLRGEVPKAFVAVHEGRSFNEQELKDFLKEQVAHFKIPHYFEVVPELPKNRTGKIDKTQLR